MTTSASSQDNPRDIELLAPHTLGPLEHELSPYRYSFTPPGASFVRSVRTAGVLKPIATDSQGRPVCGFRRLEAALEAGLPVVPVCRAPDPRAALIAGFWENLGHRSFTLLEKAFALKRLSETCGIEQKTLIEVFLPALDLPPKKSFLRKYLKVASLPQEVLDKEIRTGLKDGHLLLLCEVPREAAPLLAQLFYSLRPTVGEARDLLSRLQDIARRESMELVEVLASPHIKKYLDGPDPPRYRLEALRVALRSRALPKLAQLEKECGRLANTFAPYARIRLPANLEGGAVELTVKIRSLGRLEELVRFLGSEEARKALADLLALLRGER